MYSSGISYLYHDTLLQCEHHCLHFRYVVRNTRFANIRPTPTAKFMTTLWRLFCFLFFLRTLELCCFFSHEGRHQVIASHLPLLQKERGAMLAFAISSRLLAGNRTDGDNGLKIKRIVLRTGIQSAPTLAPDFSLPTQAYTRAFRSSCPRDGAWRAVLDLRKFDF